jgi:DNA-binding NarL/FixJ family response regulator
MTPRIVLVDDHPLFRRGVADLLRAAGTVEVVGEASDAAGALRQVTELLPDIVLLDIRLEPGSGIAMIHKLIEVHPAVRIIVLTMYDEPAFQRAAQAAGAHGYVSKRATDTKLLAAVDAVWVGQNFFEFGARPVEPSTPKLTAREREVVRGIALGYTNREIADRLDLSIKSVESYRARVIQKFGFGSRAELVRYAFQSGLLDPGTTGTTG